MPPVLLSMLCCLCLSAPAGVAGAADEPGASPFSERSDTLGLGGQRIVHLPALGGHFEDRLRLRQLLCDEPTDGFLLRSPSTLSAAPGGGAPDGRGFRWSIVAPELYAIHNSALPFSLNEGSLWAGRGMSSRMSAGARIDYRGVTVILAPQLMSEGNEDFQTFSYPHRSDQRHEFSSPFHFPPGAAPGSMDLPQRFGTDSRSHGDLGQSSVTWRVRGIAVGGATENLWWGPAIRNALIMSDNAPGVPHLFLRTASPVETRVGTWEARWMLGRMSESSYFDFDRTNDRNSLSALALVFSPRFDRGLSVGVTRAVFAPTERSGFPFDAAFDAWKNVGRPAQAEGDTLVQPGPDQLFSLFARWVFPGRGFEFYGEWGRYEQPENVRDFFVLPNHSRGYTTGLQWARPITPEVALRVQAEVTNLEPSTTYRVRQSGEWYASRAVPQGYTQRGRVIGAAIGPSGSGQWAAADLFGKKWSAGAFAGRIRWENEARFSYFPEFRRSDVTLFTGVRGARELGPVLLAGEYAAGVRLNYLFQSDPGSEVRLRDPGVDIRNRTLKITLSSGIPSR